MWRKIAHFIPKNIVFVTKSYTIEYIDKIMLKTC